MSSSARIVLPDPGSPIRMLIEFSGMPPPRISSSSRFPVVRRLKGQSAFASTGAADPLLSPLMLDPPGSHGSYLEELPHRLDEPVLGERLQQEGIGPRFTRP